MSKIIELETERLVNRAVHSMAVIVIILFAFHFARLAGFSTGSVSIAMLAAVLALGSLGLKRTISVDADRLHVSRSVSLFSIPLVTKRTDLSGIAWSGVRSDLPDLVVEAGTPADETVEVLRFRNAWGRREKDAIDACARLALALRIEDRGYGDSGPGPAESV